MIVLTILKWIGIVLLWALLLILALALLILLVVLFVPVRYRASVATAGNSDDSAETQAHQKMSERIRYGFSVTFLLHAISIRKKQDADQVVVRILGIPVKRIGGESSGTGGDDEAEGFMPEPEPEEMEMSESEPAEESPPEPLPEPEAETGTEPEPEPDIEEEFTFEKKKKQTVSERIAAIKSRIRKFFVKIDFLFFKISSIMKFVRDRAARRTVKRLLKEVVRAIRYVGPRRVRGNLEFGTGDPGSTGLILGGVSLCKPVYGKDISIIPNFEEKCLRGDAFVRGRIRTVFFVRMAIRIWFDKDVHSLWKQYRRMKRNIRKREEQISKG